MGVERGTSVCFIPCSFQVFNRRRMRPVLHPASLHVCLVHVMPTAQQLLLDSWNGELLIPVVPCRALSGTQQPGCFICLCEQLLQWADSPETGVQLLSVCPVLCSAGAPAPSGLPYLESTTTWRHGQASCRLLWCALLVRGEAGAATSVVLEGTGPCLPTARCGGVPARNGTACCAFLFPESVPMHASAERYACCDARLDMLLPY
ncbi:hypothetical protein COO60DRAFT_1574034 [Scenedesmus sp. NREL 46B-D3]|nr:hypothetical protein COO60DRAFT_1574034 [Scenedesmus sp. NREL 46B-D3]